MVHQHFKLISNFTGIENVPVDRMDARIDPSDPRHDRVMDALPGYFQASSVSASPTRLAGLGSGWSIAYIPARRAAVMDYLRIAAVLGLPRHDAWRLAEFDPIEFLVSATGLLALAALLAALLVPLPGRADNDSPLLQLKLEQVEAGSGFVWTDFSLLHALEGRTRDDLRHGRPLDMDVYDAAAWSAVTPLSEKSVAAKSRAVDFPDFTRGGWKTARDLHVMNL
jgi:hypothetical protein